MVKFDKHTSKKTGLTKTQVRVTTEVKRPDGKYSKVTVRDYGYLEDQQDQEKFLQEVRQFDIDYHSGKKIFFELENKSALDLSNRNYNFGYRFLESVYEMLEIDEFIDKISQKNKTTYDLKEVFKYDILMRILNPGSIRSTIQLKDSLYAFDPSFRLHQNYRSLDYYANWKDELLRHLNNKVKEKIGRNNEYALYDCTNYYFEKDFNGPEGTLPQKGISKEHQTTPIVQLGLFIDSNAIPVSFSLFPGNTADSKTIKEELINANERFGFKHLIVVGDKGFNCQENITKIINQGNGFIFSNKIRGRGKATPKYQKYCYDTTGWEGNDDFKYTIFEDTMKLKGLDSSNKELKIKVLIYYKKSIANLEKARREEKIRKAKEYLENNPGIVKMSNSRKTNKYLTETNLVKETGEVADEVMITLDQEKINEEAKLDGFFCLITSEAEFTKEQILSGYSQLAMIEESFKITKSDLNARPIFVSTENHIKGIFVITFVALMIIRILQHYMNENKISSQRIIEVLNSCNCNEITKDVVHIETIGGRNAFFYKTFKNDTTPKSTLELVTDIIDDGIKKDETLTEQFIDQIQNDFKKLCKTYKIEEPKMWMRKKDFIRYLSSINFSTILKKQTR